MRTPRKRRSRRARASTTSPSARKLSAADLDLGELAKSEIGEVDPAIADAAFTLKEGQPSEVVKGKFGFLIVRVTKIIAGSVKPFDEVKDEVKKLIATRRAANQIQDVHDKIEDQRVAGKSLAEAAKSVGLETRAIPAIDASGRDPNGVAVDLPEFEDAHQRGVRLRCRRRRRRAQHPRPRLPMVRRRQGRPRPRAHVR